MLQLEEVAGGTAERDALREELRGLAFGSSETLDGNAADLEAEAARHAGAAEAATIDLAVVGLDEDGGVALDAPPARLASGVRLVTLPAGQRALTVGLGTLYRARELLVLATGEQTAPALRAMLEEPPGPASPASLLRETPAHHGDLRPRGRAPARAAPAVREWSRARRPRPS